MAQPPVQFEDNSPASKDSPQSGDRRQKLLIAGAVVIAFLVAIFALLEARSAKEDASNASETNAALQSENKEELRREYIKIQNEIRKGKAEIAEISSNDQKGVQSLQKKTRELASQSQRVSKANLESTREMEQEINQLRSEVSRLAAKVDRLEGN